MSSMSQTSRISSVLSSSTDTRLIKRVSIIERNLNRTRGTEVGLGAFAFLFSEMLQYAQRRVHGIQDLERKLNDFGYRVGTRLLELIVWRDKNSKRETRVLGILYFIHTTVWKTLFGKQADTLEKSTENENEYMISDNDPLISKYISVPKELSELNCNSFLAGIVEAILDGSQFPSRVTAHSLPIDGFPLRTTIFIQLDKEILQREDQLK
ncbi:4884_t:CDS:2 [Funneliformis caledonium]|uniref:Trafficking protein particle complex subunit n=2 Tax=Funneliformis TaxID=1117308 RepID=A0A9N8VHW7_9GLOM|nr:4884_t:CDS:2 [Funneliformis caledonium]CAG8481746.1 6895_t:CDS:2 [Funneliformis mosseae]